MRACRWQGRGRFVGARTVLNQGNNNFAHAVPLAHPALAGHFPGHPIVPGVVILDHVIGSLPVFLGQAVQVNGFPMVKFLAPLAPEQPFEIAFVRKTEGQVSFEVTSAGNRIVHGTIAYRIPD